MSIVLLLILVNFVNFDKKEKYILLSGEKGGGIIKFIGLTLFIQKSEWGLILLHNVHVALGTEKILIHFLPGCVIAPQTQRN